MSVANAYNKYSKMDPVMAFAEQTGRIADNIHREYKHQIELQELEERLFQRLMKHFTVSVKNEASPAIKDIKNEIDKLFSSK